MNHLAKPQSKKRKTNQPPPSSFLSLPDVIILNCLSRISKSYYPKLSLVSKTFRSLLLSTDLNLARFHHKTQERSFHVCLKFPDRPHPSWYTLWIDKEEKKKSTLVQVPSSYTSSAALFLVNGGSYDYAFRQAYPPSKVMLVRNKDSCIWRYAPKMTVARANPIACVFRRKIYVMGGCADDESVSWGEVFDINTQTWEPLPDPGPELRFSTMIREIQIIQGKIHVKSNESKDSIYDPNNGNWNGDWRLVKGLSSLNRTCRSGLIETVKLGGKMLLLWDKSTKPGRGISEEKHICGALIAFERRKYGQVWGKVEWSNALLTVPSSYSFLRSTVIRT
ncbi:F-box/kelch-repeat protein At4g39753 [Capsella rubella]|uniref:F-box/kelch-repeat protein At4g39753 n=1 Tax=Capsella rubella TaxID=81985 RepID=UPI000CD54010|nr:F-box/kelch-repeat protein At4g39753 [Capsella rubella]